MWQRTLRYRVLVIESGLSRAPVREALRAFRPSDIDIVKAGPPVQVQFSAYTGRRTNRVMGKVAMVSADRPVDNKGQPGFRADIEVDEAEVERIAGLLLYPGMPADAFIETGRHTFARYLMAPILDGILRRVRER